MTDRDPLGCGQHEAVPWLALAGAWFAGAALTGGWVLRTAWAIAHRPETIGWIRSVR
ncbi:MAG: hypothetical protein Q4F65_05565 [Propionibacteriaceae bacterium]|nr:hypothetical protein [Propionibacteriaceae bacterium]